MGIRRLVVKELVVAVVTTAVCGVVSAAPPVQVLQPWPRGDGRRVRGRGNEPSDAYGPVVLLAGRSRSGVPDGRLLLRRASDGQHAPRRGQAAAGTALYLRHMRMPTAPAGR
jgi:hypothetical protein